MLYQVYTKNLYSNFMPPYFIISYKHNSSAIDTNQALYDAIILIRKIKCKIIHYGNEEPQVRAGGSQGIRLQNTQYQLQYHSI